ncbi:MAG TPA: prolyl oligopeptidase family serine peptidase, partial [Longimicrobiales bacterium]
ASAGVAQAPPSAPREDSVDNVFGKTIPDPYRWMEGQENPRFADWLTAQGAAGRSWLDASPALERWRTRLAAVSNATTSHYAQHRVAGRVFFMRLQQGQQGVLMERLPSGEERTLLDPNTLPASGGHASITTYAVSQDGRRVAVDVDHGGHEITSIEFYDTDSGAQLPDRIDHVWGEFNADWLPDGSGVIYTQMTPAAPGADIQLNMRARFHRMGSDTAGDPIVAAAGTNPAFPMEPQEFPIVLASTASDWAMAFATGARTESRVCLVRKSELLQARPPFNCLVRYEDHVQVADLRGSTLYLLSAQDAPNGRLLALDLTDPHPVLARARVLVPERPQDVLVGFYLARDAIYLKYMHDGIDHIVALPYDGSAAQTVPLPYDGAAYLVDSDPRADGILFSLEGYTRPRALYAFDPATRAVTDLHLGATSPRDYASAVQVITTSARSADGTMVPLTLLVPRGMKPDGKALALLEAYGGYGIPLQPFFNPMFLEWVTSGHIFARAGVRGGGEKGEAWHLAGKGPNKHRGVEDAVGAADYLVRAGYSDAHHVALYGASAGGLVTGAAVARYPDHFGAAVIHSGILDPARLAHALNGANQYAEMGDPGTRDGFAALVDMDPYLALTQRGRYPALLLDVGLNDGRVAPWNSGKFGAQLSYLSRGGLVLFRTDSDAGHFGTSLSQEASEVADHFTFVEKALGSR